MGCVRLGYFEAFKGRDTLLIDGDVEGLGDLMRTLNVSSSRAARRRVAALVAVRLCGEPTALETDWARQDCGVSRIDDAFQWRRSSTGWAAVVEQILGVKKQGRCHQYLDAPSDEVAVMVSSGEYGEPWPQLGAAPWAG